jgi:hypothetical protein
LALATAIQRRQDRGRPRASSEALPDPAEVAASALRQLVAGGAEGEPAETLVGELLLAVVTLAGQREVDPEGALRRAAASRRESMRRAELEDLSGGSATPDPVRTESPS